MPTVLPSGSATACGHTASSWPNRSASPRCTAPGSTRAVPPHVGLLLDNTPDYVFALCGAGLAGAAVIGLNYTRRGEHLGHDISHTDVQMVITEPRHEEQLRTGTEGVALPAGILVSDRFADRDEPPAAG